MPYRKTPIATGEIYHVFNRSVAKQPIFTSSRDFQRAIDTSTFYLYAKPPIRFSFYNRLPIDERKKLLESLKQNHQPLVQIFSYCFMPNHVHFLLKNMTEKGISHFMRNFQHSYSKYFNIKTHRTGTLFQPMFHAVRIETDEQLIHVSRYIHLNPVTSY